MMQPFTHSTMTIALVVALGGFLMGFDASVISGVVGFIEIEFALTKIQLGWSVALLTLTRVPVRAAHCRTAFVAGTCGRRAIT